jgi:hypothetical protein
MKRIGKAGTRVGCRCWGGSKRDGMDGAFSTHPTRFLITLR